VVGSGPSLPGFAGVIRLGAVLERVNPDQVRRRWAQRSGEYSPDYYAHYGPNEVSERIREHLAAVGGPEASVLELGCSSGRHLAHLHEHGYRDLHGIEINETAFDVMGRDYPGLAEDGSFHADAIEAVLPGLPDDRFDAVFSVETLQHLHPEDRWVFAEIARVAAERVITVEVESPTHADPEGSVHYVDDGVPLYYRDWGEIFADLGLVETAAGSAGTATLRVFAHVGG
jgi:SAM-dependent methyltransferase